MQAADVWKVPPANWTKQDFEHVLSDSPWALLVNATMDDPADRPEPARGVPTETSQAGLPTNARLGATQRWDGSVARNRMGHLATILVTVRWDSAAVMLLALKSTNEPAAAALETAASENFIITVEGLLPATTGKLPASLKEKSSSDGPSSVRTAEENLEWFMSNSSLVAKGRPGLKPQNVTIDPNTGAVRLFFKRSEETFAQKRDVFFSTRFGSITVQAKFRTKDMLYNGHPDL